MCNLSDVAIIDLFGIVEGRIQKGIIDGGDGIYDMDRPLSPFVDCNTPPSKLIC
ncbi:MAG: hypothetical protein AAF433_00015 [Bacteroidota bacterium]